MLVTMMMQFYVKSVKHGSTSNVIILTMLTTNICKIVMSHGIASLVPILFPFGNLNNQNFLTFIGDNNTTSTIFNETKHLNRFLLLKPAPDLALLFNQFNNAIPENHSDPENVIQSKYHSNTKLYLTDILLI